MKQERMKRREQRRGSTEVRIDGRCRSWAGAIEFENGFGYVGLFVLVFQETCRPVIRRHMRKVIQPIASSVSRT